MAALAPLNPQTQGAETDLDSQEWVASIQGVTPMSTSLSFLTRRLLGAVACVALTAAPAAAGTLTMNGWLFGAGHKVQASSPGYSGLAGGFGATLTGMTDARFNLDALELYCVDLAQTININAGTRFTVKLDGEAGSSTFTIVPVAEAFGAARADRLAQLVSYAGSAPSVVNSSQRSTALQLAIWNVVYDPDETLTASTGALFSDASVYRSGANDLLAQSAGWAVDRELYVMRSASRQDQLFWLDTHGVPEPASGVLAALALGVLAAGRRFRAASRARSAGA